MLTLNLNYSVIKLAWLGFYTNQLLSFVIKFEQWLYISLTLIMKLQKHYQNYKHWRIRRGIHQEKEKRKRHRNREGRRTWDKRKRRWLKKDFLFVLDKVWIPPQLLTYYGYLNNSKIILKIKIKFIGIYNLIVFKFVVI